ncbi:MAG: DUF2187 family protein [Ruoffia tabacinasalis]|uniref:DUF2187 domain-containing protein n=1 Tax=Ruoffia tabacinasalis TaxID=87458 RepID=A0A5R9EMM5_9LACT|nr:DUF2187 family protein [Ruoffia tabacinasalis]TLQ48908.1 DUF2187 domain-containing protein [Ruoffia tabacinasalis]HBY89175.1 DUF2187 domain-containing protein [Aerococcaceae bacterium]
MSAENVTASERKIIERELRRGTSKSRIAAILDVDYDKGLIKIESVKDKIRPEVGNQIEFKFRDSKMTGIIIKLLTNSAVVEIYWSKSDITMRDICEDRTIVNFKDIESFVSLPEQVEDEDIMFEYEEVKTTN